MVRKTRLQSQSPINHIITNLENKVSSGERAAPLRFTAGLLGVSHTTVYDWKNGDYLPKLEQLAECSFNIAAAHEAVQLMMRELTPKAADLVVAEANE